MLLISACCAAQFGQADDVILINGRHTLEPYQNRLKFDLTFDARRTLLNEEWLAVGGIRVGVEYRRIHRVGLGFYFLNTRIFTDNFDYSISEDVVEYQFGYNTLYYERTLYFDPKWEMGGTIHLGGGTVNVYYNPDGLNNRELLDEVPFNAMELSAYGKYSILYWLGVGAGLGYRGVWGAEKEMRQTFSSPIFTLKLQVKLVKLARSFFDESVKDEY